MQNPISDIDAVEMACDMIETKGFVFDARSGVSEARYFSFPGYWDRLRVAAHGCRHGYRVAYSLEFVYREAWQHDDNDIGLDRDGVAWFVDDAIEAFFDRAELDEDEDEEAA